MSSESNLSKRFDIRIETAGKPGLSGTYPEGRDSNVESSDSGLGTKSAGRRAKAARNRSPVHPEGCILASLRITESKVLSSEICPIQPLAGIRNRDQARTNPRSEDPSKFVASRSRQVGNPFDPSSGASSSTQLGNPAEIASKAESFASNSESKNTRSES
jgi:hypothetical protein